MLSFVKLTVFFAALLLLRFSVTDGAKRTAKVRSNPNQNQDKENDDGDDNSVDQSGNGAGIHFRVTDKGVNYLTRAFGDILNDLIPVMPVPDMEQEFKAGYMKLYNMHVQNFKPADQYSTEMHSPNKLIWTMADMDIGLKGDIDGEYNGKSASGQFDTMGTDTTFVVPVLIQSDPDTKKQLYLNAIDCKITMKKFDFNVYNLEDRLQALFTQFKSVVVNFLRPRIQDQLCMRVKNFINEKMNDQLRVQGRYQALGKAKNFNFTSGGTTMAPMPQQIQDIMNNMFIDYGLTQDPRVTSKFVDVWSKGEVSLQGTGGTPFTPTPMNDASSEMLDRMSYMAISDYVMNSLLYNSYQHKLLNLKLNKNTAPDLANFFKVTQCTDICLGVVFPELVNYPDNDYEIQFQPTEAPSLTTGDGTAKLVAKTIVTLVGRQNIMAQPTEYLKHDLSLDANVKPYLENNLLKGEMVINNINANLIKTQFQNFDQNRLNQITRGTKVVLQTNANKALKQGVQLPAGDVIKLINPKLNILNRHMRIDTDMELNKVALVQKISSNMLPRNP